MKMRMLIQLSKSVQQKKEKGIDKLNFPRPHFYYIMIILLIQLSKSVPIKAAGTTGADFLNIGVGARNIGMGEASGAISDDINSAYWNPAGLNHLRQPMATFSHAQWFEDILYQQVCFARPFKTSKVTPPFANLAWGISVYYLSMDKFQGWDEDGKKTGEVGASDMAVVFSGSFDIRNFRKFPFKNGSRLFGGLNVKYISQKLDKYSADSFASDIGLQWWETSEVVNKGWRIGLNFQNIGTEIKFDRQSGPLPTNLKAGFGYRAIIAGDPVTLSFDINSPNESDKYFTLGGEYVIKDFFSLRLGYRTATDAGRGFRAGMGINVGLYSIDYAFAGFGELGGTHRISLIVRFGSVVKVIRLEDKDSLIKLHLDKGNKLFEEGRFPEAILEFNSVLEIDPLNAEAFNKMKGTDKKLDLIEELK